MEDSLDIRNRSEVFTQSFARSPKSSFLESRGEGSNPGYSMQKKIKHISFHTPVSGSESKNSTVAHSRHTSDSLTPHIRNSIIGAVDPRQKSNPLWRLKEKFSKITEELDTARETARESHKETIYYNEEPIQAETIENDFEFNGYPTLRWCAYCAKETTTEITYKNTSQTFLASLGIFLAGGVFGCFLLPYASTSCKHTSILCHICKREVGEVQ